MSAAAKNLTPVTLELGGKSPAIVTGDANIKLAAKKIVWGKFNNAGQTCIAPDYVLAESSVHDSLISTMKETVRLFYGDDPQKSADYGRMINSRHTERIAALIDKSKVVLGGYVDVKKKYIAPTIMTNVTRKDAVMRDEIFGPVLPVIKYNSLDEAVEYVRSFPKPLALYVFTRQKKIEEKIISSLRFGGGCVNSTILHVASSNLPFGGVGPSGIGSYHGKAGFDDFSHKKSVLRQSSVFDFGIAYPGKQLSLKWLKKFIK